MTTQSFPLAPSSNPVDRLYRLLVGGRVLGVLLVLLVLSVLTGLALPQVPSTLVEPDAAARWLVETSSRYGDLGSLMQTAGLFDIWRSVWLRGLLAAVAFVLLLRLGLAIGDAASRLRHPDPAAGAAEARRWPLHASVELRGDSAAAAAELSEDLHSEGWRIAQAETASSVVIVAERNPSGLLAVPLCYFGLLLTLAGLWLGQLMGWSEGGVVLLPGRPVALNHNNRLSVSLSNADAESGAVTVQASGGDAVTRSFSPAGRARLAGLTVRRMSEGQALLVDVSDQNGQALQLQSSDQPGSPQTSLGLIFDQPRTEQVFFVPARQLVVSVVGFPALPERGFSGPTFLVQAFRAGIREPVFNQFVEGDADLTVADDVLRLRSDSMMIVEISRNPAAPLAAAGLALALIGLALALWRPAGRLVLSIRSAPGGSARSREAGLHRAVSVDVSLQPSLVWRQAGQWLLAWTSTYSAHDS